MRRYLAGALSVVVVLVVADTVVQHGWDLLRTFFRWLRRRVEALVEAGAERLVVRAGSLVAVRVRSLKHAAFGRRS